MILPKFEYAAVSTPEEAIAAIAGHKGKAEIMVAGTDLMVKMRRRMLAPDLVVSIHKLDRLRGFDQPSEDQYRIGVLNTMHEITSEATRRPGMTKPPWPWTRRATWATRSRRWPPSMSRPPKKPSS